MPKQRARAPPTASDQRATRELHAHREHLDLLRSFSRRDAAAGHPNAVEYGVHVVLRVPFVRRGPYAAPDPNCTVRIACIILNEKYIINAKNSVISEKNRRTCRDDIVTEHCDRRDAASSSAGVRVECGLAAVASHARRWAAPVRVRRLRAVLVRHTVVVRRRAEQRRVASDGGG